MGAWREMMDDGLTTAAFRERFLEIVGAVPHDWIIEAKGNTGPRPVALVLAGTVGAGRIIEPHVEWMPWATNRNKVEAVSTFLRDVGRSWKIFIFVDERNEPFWRRMVRYRILRRGCKVSDHFARGDDAWFYYTTGP